MTTPDQRLLIRADRLWSGGLEASIAPGHLLIDHDRIVARGPDAVSAGGAEVVDLPGCTLIPGLIDMHGHARINQRTGRLAEQVRDEPVRYVLRAVGNLQDDLRAGVTTVKTNGDRDFLDVGLRDAIADGLLVGPRLRVAGRGIKSPDCTAGIVATAFCRGPLEIQAAVRENLERGADHIKLYVSGGLLEPIDEACKAYYSYEEIHAAVQEAEAGGSYVSAHCVGGSSANWCAEAGVRVLEHGYYLTDRQLELLRERGTWLDLTLGVGFHPEGHAAEAIRHGADPADLRRRESLARDTARRALACGTPVLLGTDSMHGLLAYEAEQVVALGASPAAALRAMTCDAASVLGLDGQVGRLEPGQLADVVGVRGDPTQDVTALWSVEAVFKEGRRLGL